jgi:hypothetical protein
MVNVTPEAMTYRPRIARSGVFLTADLGRVAQRLL